MAITPNLGLSLLVESQAQKSVTLNNNATLIDAMLASGILTGTLAARPAAGWAGRLYLATDVGNEALYRDTGSAWVSLLSGGAHLNLGGGTAPTAAAGSNAGTSPPAPVVAAAADDSRGSLTFGTGTSPAAGNAAVVTFHAAFGTAPFVLITPNNALTAALNPYLAAVGTTSFTLGFQTAPAASQANTVYGCTWLAVQ